jgi:hypothetical protein
MRQWWCDSLTSEGCLATMVRLWILPLRRPSSPMKVPGMITCRVRWSGKVPSTASRRPEIRNPIWEEKGSGGSKRERHSTHLNCGVSFRPQLLALVDGDDVFEE